MKCPADAPKDGKRSAEPLNGHGTERLKPSDVLVAILSELSLINHSLETVIEQQDEMIRLLQGEGEEEAGVHRHHQGDPQHRAAHAGDAQHPRRNQRCAATRGQP